MLLPCMLLPHATGEFGQKEQVRKEDWDQKK
jgi:hypothetical protein